MNTGLVSGVPYSDGDVYITDSFRAVVYRIPAAEGFSAAHQ